MCYNTVRIGIIVIALILLVFSGLSQAAVLYDNGPLVNSPGTGAGGADESVLQNVSLGMTILGFGHQVNFNIRIADDFTVTGSSWQIDTITFYAYQTNSPTTSTMTAVNLRIWDGQPGVAGSNVIFGDTTTDRLTNTTWSNIYRVSEINTGVSTARPIMANTVTIGISLTPGTYWLDWQTGGTLGSGPWAPPITISGQSTTGNGRQSLDGGVTWGTANDPGTGTPQQGFPFIIEGSAGGVQDVVSGWNFGESLAKLVEQLGLSWWPGKAGEPPTDVGVEVNVGDPFSKHQKATQSVSAIQGSGKPPVSPQQQPIQEYRVIEINGGAAEVIVPVP